MVRSLLTHCNIKISTSLMHRSRNFFQWGPASDQGGSDKLYKVQSAAHLWFTGHNKLLDTGYPHDGRANKDSYPHDGRADKDSYPHDGRADKNPYRHDRHMQSFNMLVFALRYIFNFECNYYLLIILYTYLANIMKWENQIIQFCC